MILKKPTLLTWMHNKRELVQHVTLWNKIKSTHCHYCSNDNDDNVMCATVLFEFFDGLFNVKTSNK